MTKDYTGNWIGQEDPAQFACEMERAIASLVAKGWRRDDAYWAVVTHGPQVILSWS